LFFVLWFHWYSVSTIEPFAEVNQFAAIAAERVKFSIAAELLSGFIHNFIACWTSAFHIDIKSNIFQH
jgi:hypothetical protein